MKTHNLTVYLIAGVMAFGSSSLLAQNDDSNRYPHYTVPYVCPQESDVISKLNSVREYYEKTSQCKILDSKTGKEITNLSKKDENAILSPGFAGEWSYTNGVVLSAFDYLDNILDDKRYFENNKRFYDYVITSLSYFDKYKMASWKSINNMHALDDCGSIGAAMIKTYLKTKDKRYLDLINRVDDYVSNKQFRMSDGTLARHRPQYVSVWSDDMYMSVPFLVNMGKMTNNTKYYDDAVQQILGMRDRLFVPQAGIFDHGWNETSSEYDPHFFWGRANGWVMMSMAETLSILPENYKGREEILKLFRTMSQELAHLQGGDGFWHNLLDKCDTYNETSCTAMFTYAIAKGINEGWISHVYGPVALTGWNALSTVIKDNGAVDGTCEGTTFAHDNTYYYHRGASIHATHGYGVVLYAGAEIIKLLRNNALEIQKPKDNSINSTIHFKKRSEWK